VRADAVISPANSFGFMDGGIDALFTFTLGPRVQERVQAAIRADFDGELPVGCALIVSTRNADIPWCISAPTMRVRTQSAIPHMPTWPSARRCWPCDGTTPTMRSSRFGPSCVLGSGPASVSCRQTAESAHDLLVR
jgi:hypothetical protein